MRLGFVTTSYPQSSAPIAGSFVRTLARALVRAGHTVEVLAPEPSTGGPIESDAGISVHLVRYAWPRALGRTFYGAGVPDNARGSAAAWPGLVTYPLALARALRRSAPRWDAVVSHWALPSALAVERAALGVPHVAFLHSADVHLLERLPLGRSAARRIALGARALAFSSRDLGDRFGRLAPAPRGAVVPIGSDEPFVEPEERAHARAALGVQGFLALALARHVPVKGLDVAIEAVAGGDGRVGLALAGDGPERARLEARAAAHGANVRFLGTVTGELRRRWLAAADVVVVPSRVLPSGRTEGAPTVLFEALAAGLPVVASDVGGARELVREDNGILVPPGDAPALRGALEALARDASRRVRLGRGARATPVPEPDDAARFVLDALGR